MDKAINGNVKWSQLVVVSAGLFGTIVGVFIWGVNNVAANDRLRAIEDLRLDTRIETSRNERIAQYGDIIQRLVRIETLVRSDIK